MFVFVALVGYGSFVFGPCFVISVISSLAIILTRERSLLNINPLLDILYC